MNYPIKSLLLKSGLLVLAVLAVFCSNLSAQSRSRVAGTIVDEQTGEAIIGANVIVVGTSLGAATDLDGNYIIINVPVGTYTIQATMLGYAKSTIKGVIVSLDRVSTVDIKMKTSEISLNEVVIEAERNALYKEVASTQNVVTEDQLKNTAGVREISDLLVMQPGVVREGGFITVRGGSADQTGTMVNGIAFNNAAIGNSSTSIPMSAIEQVSVLPGGFNAEYGNFRSGLISVVTKSGKTDRYSGTVNISRNSPHQKRFGPALSDPKGPLLSPWLDADAAFIGTETAWANDPYKRQQQISGFEGWNKNLLGVEVNRRVLGWTNSLNDNYLIIEVVLKNVGAYAPNPAVPATTTPDTLKNFYFWTAQSVSNLARSQGSNPAPPARELSYANVWQHYSLLGLIPRRLRRHFGESRIL